MKRYGKQALVSGTRIQFTSVHRIYGNAPSVISGKYGEKIGYITYNDFYRMVRDCQLVLDFGDYWYAEYVVK